MAAAEVSLNSPSCLGNSMTLMGRDDPWGLILVWDAQNLADCFLEKQLNRH